VKSSVRNSAAPRSAGAHAFEGETRRGNRQKQA
jgi:hypothetical protein